MSQAGSANLGYPHIPEAVARRELGLSPEGIADREQAQVAVDGLLTGRPGRLVVVSDLHLGRGREPGGDRFVRSENFFADESFGRLLDYWLARPPGAGTQVLVLNGDIFDFVRHAAAPSCTRPDTPDLLQWQGDLAAIGIAVTAEVLQASITPVERRYGVRSDPVKSVWKLGGMARGHRGFLQGLARWLNGGGWIVFLKGNHDLEIHWLTVRDAIRQQLSAVGASASATQRVLFGERLYATAANLYLEHGHQYEKMTRVVDGPLLVKFPLELAYPLGSFVNRYLINPLERIAPFLDNVKPVQDAVVEILRRYPLRALGILAGARRFLLRALRMGRWGGFVVFLGYFLLVVLPYLTVLLIALAIGSPRVGDWLQVHLGSVRFPLSALGLLAPYLFGALKELVAAFGLGRKRGLAEKLYDSASEAGTLPDAASGPLIYLVVGHTHEQDSRWLEQSTARRTYYLNSGTWAPLWPKDRPDLIGRTLHPVLVFAREGNAGYRHAYYEWNDELGEPVPTVILGRE